MKHGTPVQAHVVRRSPFQAIPVGEGAFDDPEHVEGHQPLHLLAHPGQIAVEQAPCFDGVWVCAKTGQGRCQLAARIEHVRVLAETG